MLSSRQSSMTGVTPVAMNTGGRDPRRRRPLARSNWLRGLGLENFEGALFSPALAEDDTPRNRRHWKRVARRCHRHLARGNYSAENWIRYGYALQESGELNVAAHAYAMALSLEADSFADAYLQAGHLHEARGDTQKAVHSYKSALKLNPEIPEAAEQLRALGLSPAELSSIIEAAKADRHSIGLHPADRVLAAKFMGGPPIRRRKWGPVLAAAIAMLCLVWSEPSVLAGRTLEMAEDAYQGVLAQAHRLSDRLDVEVKAAARSGAEERALTDAAARKAAEKEKAVAEAAARKAAEESAAVEAAARKAAEERDTAAAQKAAEREKAVAEAAARKAAEERAAVEAAVRRAAEQEKAVAEEAARKAAEDARLKAEEAARKAQGKPRSGAEVGEKAGAAVVLSEQDRRRVQVALNSLGHEFPTVTGYFGPRTHAMIMAWQRAQGLAETGSLTEGQWAMLQQQAASALAKYDQAQMKPKEERMGTR